MTIFLSLQNISKRFGGVHALRDVDIRSPAGEVHCLVGENGSGKSTLIKIISGVRDPEPGGRIVIEGHDYRAPDAGDSRRPAASRSSTRTCRCFRTSASPRTSPSASHLGAPQSSIWATMRRHGARRPWRASASSLDPDARSRTCPSPAASSSPSAAPWRRTPSWSSWTSRPRRSPGTRSTRCCALVADLKRQGHLHRLRLAPAERGAGDRRAGHGAARRPKVGTFPAARDGRQEARHADDRQGLRLRDRGSRVHASAGRAVGAKPHAAGRIRGRLLRHPRGRDRRPHRPARLRPHRARACRSSA